MSDGVVRSLVKLKEVLEIGLESWLCTLAEEVEVVVNDEFLVFLELEYEFAGFVLLEVRDDEGCGGQGYALWVKQESPEVSLSQCFVDFSELYESLYLLLIL